MSTDNRSWTSAQRGKLFSLMSQANLSKENLEALLGFPLSELSLSEASALIDCFVKKGDLSTTVGIVQGMHMEVSKGPLDKIPASSQTPSVPRTREEALQRRQQNMPKSAPSGSLPAQKVPSQATEESNTAGRSDQLVEFSNEKPYLPIDLVDIDKAVALYEKFEYAKRRLAKPEDIQDAGNRKFYKKAFWRKAGTAFFVDYQIVGEPIIQQLGDEIVCTVYAVARWGNRTLTDVGVYSSKEFIGRRKFNYPDLISSAATRAINRVISDMIGGGEVTADELTEEPHGEFGQATREGSYGEQPGKGQSE